MASLRGPPGPPPGPPMYLTPRDTAAGEVASLGGGAKPTIWTVEGDNLMSNDDKLKGKMSCFASMLADRTQGFLFSHAISINSENATLKI